MRKHIEDAAATIIEKDHDDRRHRFAGCRAQFEFVLKRKRVEVVEQRKISGKKIGLVIRLRCTKRGGKRAVDPVEPTICEQRHIAGAAGRAVLLIR